jgi:hypothetical protein
MYPIGLYFSTYGSQAQLSKSDIRCNFAHDCHCSYKPYRNEMSSDIDCIFKYRFNNSVVLSFVANRLQFIIKQSQSMNDTKTSKFNKFDAIIILATIMCVLLWQLPFVYSLCRSRYVFVSPFMIFVGLVVMKVCKPAFSYNYTVPLFLLLLIFLDMLLRIRL